MSQWKVRLDGDPADLDDASQRHSLSALTVARDDHGFYLESDRFERLTGADEVRTEARSLLKIVNCFGKLRGAGRIRDGAITRGSEKYIFLEGVLGAHGRVLIPGVDPSDEHPSAEAREIRWTRAALSAPAIQRVASLYVLDDDWVNLSRVLEQIEEDAGPVHKHGWVSHRKIERLKHTANSYRAVGDGARHARTDRKPPKKPMSLQEAQELVREIVQRWVESKT